MLLAGSIWVMITSLSPAVIAGGVWLQPDRQTLYWHCNQSDGSPPVRAGERRTLRQRRARRHADMQIQRLVPWRDDGDVMRSGR